MNSSKYVCALAVAASAIWFSPSGFAETIPYTDRARVANGNIVYDAHCAACHGGNLQGQANWQVRNNDGYLPAPPHDETGHTWHHPDQFLFEWTKFGPQHFAGLDYRSIMPPYNGVLSDPEIWDALAYIKSKWPESIRIRHTQAFTK